MPSSCALLGGFAIGVLRAFCCYDNITPNAKCQRVLVVALFMVAFCRLLMNECQCQCQMRNQDMALGLGSSSTEIGDSRTF